MLRKILLTNIGPSPKMELKLSPRLNLITGDNGLGKSFLLDIAWWALTERWPAQVNPRMHLGKMPLPRGTGDAEIECLADIGSGEIGIRGQFNRFAQTWNRVSERRIGINLVVYALPDGCFSVYDPYRNYFQTMSQEEGLLVRPPAFVLTTRDVWDGLYSYTDPHISFCNGLIRDWASWQKEEGDAFKQLQLVLKQLSPSQGEVLLPGKLTRVSLTDVRDMPTITTGDGQEVPVLHASSGIRRILALAYLLVWTWQEHQKAAKLLQMETIKEFVFLIDEIESHLHPSWQRSIIGSLLAVSSELSNDVQFQIIATTHSPLVMASVEPFFDCEKDAWFDLDMTKTKGDAKAVTITNRPFVRHGEATSWLISEAFDLTSSRSLQAEQVLKKAFEVMSNPNCDTTSAREVDRQLHSVLGDTDPFWLRWRFIAEKKGWLE